MSTVQELYDHLSEIREELKQLWELIRNLEQKQELIDCWQQQIFKKVGIK